MKRLFAFILAVLLVVSTAGCMAQVQAEDLMEGITPQEVEAVDSALYSANVADFAVRLLQTANQSGENTLVSPLSVLYALAMTANGAKGETLGQMEAVLGIPVSELNGYLHSYMQSLSQGEKYKLNLANSIWFTDHERFTVNQNFLQTNADYYGAEIYKTPFDDAALRDINNWVKQETDGMIPSILDEIPPNAVMYLVNALAFEAEWEEVYEEDQVHDGVFTKEDGTTVDVEYMSSTESRYMEDANATGFVKYYADRKYAFAALLPREGISMEAFLEMLTGRYLSELFFPRYDGSVTGGAFYSERVQVTMPKFETEYSNELSQILSEMGMPVAFDPIAADFSGLGESDAGNIFINRVLHKTFISVGEQGTRAGAATVVEMTDEMAIDVGGMKEVCLDRPFVYMLIDVETGVPFFIGTMMDPTV